MAHSSPSHRSYFSAINTWLSLLGLVSVLSYFVAVKSVEGNGDAFPYCVLVEVLLLFAGAWIVTRYRAARSTFVVIILFAIALRSSVLFSDADLSTDVYRYVWDGRVQGAGINPYRYVPGAPELAKLRDDEIYPHVNRADYAPTIYPPAAQMIFFLATRPSSSITWMKAVITAFDLLSGWLVLKLIAVAGLPRERVLLYAWHPLVIWEFAGNGHVDAAMILFVLLAVLSRVKQRDAATGIFLGLAAATKLYPVVLFPALWRRWNLKMPVAMFGAIAAAYLPYMRVGKRVLGFLPGYAHEEGMVDGSGFFLLTVARRVLRAPALPVWAFALFAALTLAALAIWSLWRKSSSPRDALVAVFAIAATLTLLLSPEYMWYYSWLIPFLCFVPFFPLLFFTAMAFFLNQTALQDPHGPRWQINLCLYIPLLLLSLASLYRSKDRRPYASRVASETK